MGFHSQKIQGITPNLTNSAVLVAKVSDNSTLTPLNIPSFKSLNTNLVQNQDCLKIALTVNAQLQHATVKVLLKSKIIYQAILPNNMLNQGNHLWEWNGYDQTGILNTKTLKDPALMLEFECHYSGGVHQQQMNLNGVFAKQDWVDVKINSGTNTVDIELRVNIQDGGSEGVGEHPPASVRKMQGYASQPSSVKQPHIRTQSFNNLKVLVLQGLSKYWSRSISSHSGGRYSVQVNAIHSTKNAMDDIEVFYNTNRSWLRSSNPGSVRGLYSFFGNFVPERIAYNVGWIEYSNGWNYISGSDANLAFSETAAHEIGHEILSAYGGDKYSYSHKGSSSILTQKTKTSANGGVTYPSQGGIDLMKYYNGRRPYNFYSRVFASEQDVKSLIWLASVRFDG